MTVSEADFLRHIEYLSLHDRSFVERTLRRATELHSGQTRDSGLPYITHPLAVADYLSQLDADANTLAAALLHDVVEDDRISMAVLQEEFGPDVAKLVDAVTKLTKVHYEGVRGERQIASLRKMLLTASEDLRVLLIKLADRWHNVETISGLRPDKQVRVAHETLDIYVPFARLVGLYELKGRFEEICFPIAYPQESALWHDAIVATRASLQNERQLFLKRIDAETDTHVTPRLNPMTDYEIYKKLQGNIARLSDSQNIDSMILIVNRAEDAACYDVLGSVHVRYPVRAYSFKDFISAPQPNGYRALHTTIFLARNHQLQLRILTQAMHEHATKRKMSTWLSGDTHFSEVLASINRLPFEKEKFMSDLKSNVLAGRINVFTTSGEILNLPHDATGIDFAFALNPDNIAYLAGVRINGETREATATLREGDTVEIIVFDAASPAIRSQWMEKVKSIQAREMLRENISMTPRDRQVSEGKSILEAECRKHALPMWWLFHLQSTQRRLASAQQQPSFEELLISIANGRTPLANVLESYRELLTVSPSIFLRILQFFHLLPRSRLLSQDSTVIKLEIYAQDRKGLIYDVTKVIAERNLNIAKFQVFAIPPSDALYTLAVEVEKFQEFSDLFDALLQIPSVKKILRK